MRYKNNIRSNIILMIDDNPIDVMLIKEAFKFNETNIEIYVTEDGIYAMEFLSRQGNYVNAPRPDIILLDLNMPRKNGDEVLSELKMNASLKTIPVIIYTSSIAIEDIRAAYINQANSYIKKPADFDECIKVAKSIQDFWFSTALLSES